jgi:hypothetical protein
VCWTAILAVKCKVFPEPSCIEIFDLLDSMRAGWPGWSELLGGKLGRPLRGICFPDLLDVEAADAESVVHVDGTVRLVSIADGPKCRVTSDVSDVSCNCLW